MYIKVKVFPGSKKQLFVETADLRFEARIKEPAERNLANGAVRELVAGHYGVPIGKVRLISGHQSPSKIFSVEND